MSPAKSALAALAIGLAAYFVIANVGAIFSNRGDSVVALIGAEVSPSLAPGVTEVPNRVTKSGTNLALGAKIVSPSLAPAVTSVAPSPVVSVTPRISSLVTPPASPTASVTPRVSVTPNPTPTPSPTPTPPPIPSPTLTPTPSTLPPSVTSTPSVGTPHVVINEIAWAGTASGSATNPATLGSVDEWIELFNFGTGPQELEGWSLCGDDIKIVTFGASHRIEQGQFFLVERTDDTTVSNIPADYAGSFGKSLVDAGLHLTLASGACLVGDVIDEVGPGGWYAGATVGRMSMERISAAVAGNDPSNWATWGTVPDAQGNVISTGKDAGGNDIRGTPKFKNSVIP